MISYSALAYDEGDVLKGYFVNDLMKKVAANSSKTENLNLTISSHSPDIIQIPERIVMSNECITNSNKYTVVYIPHDQLGRSRSECDKNQFFIPFKLEVLSNRW